MSKLQKFLGGALLVAVILTAGWYFINKYVLVKDHLPSNQNVQTAEPVNNTNNQTTVPVVINQEQANLRSLGLFFASRLGSYSTTSQFSNLKEIDYLLTNKMRAWAQNYIATSLTPLGYYSVITRGLGANIESFTNNQAQMVVGTQRQEVFKVGGEMQLRYQNLLLQFIKVGEDWKVDEAKWQ